MMKILVVTGGIGSGKSEVCRILGDLGVRYIYDADSKAKELYVSHKTLLKDIEDQLGQSFCHEGVFQPRLLAARIFSDKSALAKVEELLFPAMIEDFYQFAEGAGQDEIVVFESATILEKPRFDGFADKVLLVDAPYELRLERACRRDSATREAVEARMDNQVLMNELSAGYFDPRVDYRLINDGPRGQLKDKVMKAMTALFEGCLK